MTDQTNQERNKNFRRSMLRSRFQSLFWAAFLDKKKKYNLSLTQLADAIGIHKSYVSRSFTNPPNWQIDKISDFADALGLEIEICAVDKNTGEVFTPQGKKNSFTIKSANHNGADFSDALETRTSNDPIIKFETEVLG